MPNLQRTDTALVIDEQSYCYAELFTQAKQIAALLIDKQCNRVGIVSSRHFITYSSVFAALTASITYVALDPQLPINRLASIAESAELDNIIINANETSLIDSLKTRMADKLLVVKPQPPTSPQAGAFNFVDILKQQPQHIACILFTSGSTGQPKGIPISNANLIAFITAMQQRYLFSGQDRFAQFASLTFDMSLFEILLAWQAKAALYVVPQHALLAPAHFIQRHQISVWYSVPSVIDFLSRLNLLAANSLPSLRYSLFAGEELLTHAAQSWQRAAPHSLLENLYGPSESNVCLMHHFDANNTSTTQVPIGKPIGQMQVALINKKGQFIQSTEPGELIVSGPQLFNDYLTSPPNKKSPWIVLPNAQGAKQRWYLTGDRCYRDEQGIYHYLGRLDHQVKIQGHRVELAEIDAHLRQIKHVKAAISITCKTSSVLGNVIYSFVIAPNINQQTIKQHLKTQLPAYMLPKKIILVEQFPYNAQGKIDRQQLLKSAT